MALPDEQIIEILKTGNFTVGYNDTLYSEGKELWYTDSGARPCSDLVYLLTKALGGRIIDEWSYKNALPTYSTVTNAVNQ